MRHEKSCGAVIFRRIGGTWNVLLIQHEKGNHVAFPKGHVELGETEAQTAEREIREETGLSVRVDTGFRAENTYMVRADTEKRVVYFVAVTGDQPLVAQRGEVREVSWEPVKTAPDRLTYARDGEIMKDAFAYLCSHDSLWNAGIEA